MVPLRRRLRPHTRTASSSLEEGTLETKPVQSQKLVFHIPSGRDVEVSQQEWTEIQAILSRHTRESSVNPEAR